MQLISQVSSEPYIPEAGISDYRAVEILQSILDTIRAKPGTDYHQPDVTDPLHMILFRQLNQNTTVGWINGTIKIEQEIYRRNFLERIQHIYSGRIMDKTVISVKIHTPYATEFPFYTERLSIKVPKNATDHNRRVYIFVNTILTELRGNEHHNIRFYDKTDAVHTENSMLNASKYIEHDKQHTGYQEATSNMLKQYINRDTVSITNLTDVLNNRLN